MHQVALSRQPSIGRQARQKGSGPRKTENPCLPANTCACSLGSKQDIADRGVQSQSPVALSFRGQGSAARFVGTFLEALSTLLLHDDYALFPDAGFMLLCCRYRGVGCGPPGDRKIHSGASFRNSVVSAWVAARVRTLPACRLANPHEFKASTNAADGETMIAIHQ